MAIQTMNAMSEIESIINPPSTPDLKRDEEGKFISPEAPKLVPKEAKESSDEVDETPEWVTRLKISPDQHKGITDVIKRAIGKKHGQAKDAEEFAESQYNERMLAQRRTEALEQEVARYKASQVPEQPKVEAKKPERSTFADDEAYIEAVADWKTEQKFKEREQKAIADRESARQQEVIAAATARIVAAREVVDDYDEVVGSADIEVPGHIAQYMQESDLFAELGYHFAKHPEDLRKLSEMPATNAVQAARIGVAISKIEGKIQPFASRTVTDTPKAKTTNGAMPSDDEDGDLPSDTGSIPRSKPRAAAPVIQPLSSSSNTQVEKRESNMSYDEARSSWEKRNRRNFDVRKRH